MFGEGKEVFWSVGDDGEVLPLQAEQVRAGSKTGWSRWGVHPDKTKIVTARTPIGAAHAEHTSFTFLGFTFRARRALNKNEVVFTSFLPAVSKDALKKMGRKYVGGGCIGVPISTSLIWPG